MFKIFSAFLFTLMITLVATSPVPSIPLVILSYKVNGLVLGYLTSLIGGLLAGINQFFLSRRIVLNVLKRKFPNKYKFTKKYSNIISRMTYFEFIFLLLSGTIPSTIISVASGLSNIKFRKFIICIVLVSIPQQLIFLLAASQLGTIEKVVNIWGLNGVNSLIVSLSSVSLLAFMILYAIRLTPELMKLLKRILK
tara:strand:+ start:275 stop:859 length:585 start_codon:yes stop_codon:yes gene_type:complete